MSHSQDLYSSLNFITAKKLLRETRKTHLGLTFNRHALFDLLKRASMDSTLRGRHKGIALLANIAVKTRVHYLDSLVPIFFQPVMDVEVKVMDLKIIP